MAITPRAVGAWAYAASGSVTTTLPTHATGDMLLVRVAYKSSAIATCLASTATSGWAKVGEFNGGSTNSGNGVGSVNVAAFWKQAASASETDPTVTFSQAVTQVGHVGVSYQKGGSEVWATPSGVGAADSSAGTFFSPTSSTPPGGNVTTGDLIDQFCGICDDTTITAQTMDVTSVTLGALTEYPATAGIDTSGADGAYDGGYALATAGTGTTFTGLTASLTTTETGSGWWTRLRVTAAVANPPYSSPYPPLLAQ